MQRAHIVELHTYLRAVRPSYLSTAHPPRRKTQAARTSPSQKGARDSKFPRADPDRVYLNEAQRTEIDAQAKQLLRELHAAITGLAEAEQVRQSAETAVALRKRARKGLGALGRWAAGGAITAKSPEEEAEDAKANMLKAHREGVIWYLQQRLEECGGFQSSMMEIRITREVEKNKSVLYKARGPALAAERARSTNEDQVEMDYRSAVQLPDDVSAAVEQELSPEQLQLFASENQDMLKHYEDTLDQVR